MLNRKHIRNEAGQQNFGKIRIPYLLRFYCPLWTRITTCVAYASQSIGKAKRIVDTCVWQRRNRTGVLIVERRGGRKRGKGGQIRESREKKGGERLQFAEPRCETRQLSDGEEREREKKENLRSPCYVTPLMKVHFFLSLFFLFISSCYLSRSFSFLSFFLSFIITSNRTCIVRIWIIRQELLGVRGGRSDR